MSTLMKFELGPNILQFEAGADYPATRRTEMLQVQDRTAGGTMQTETVGVTLTSRVLQFNLMPEVDYLALLDWFINICQGSALSFDFTDEYGYLAEARITNNILDFAETSLKRFSGNITLEYV